MNVSFRKYKSNDLDQLQILMEELGYPVSKEQLDKNIELIIKRGGEIIIADEEGEVVGSACIIIDARLAEGLYAEIVSLVVSSDSRFKGIGKRLVKRAEEWARLQTNKVRVRTNLNRREAHSFYESLGYENKKKQKIFTKSV